MQRRFYRNMHIAVPHRPVGNFVGDGQVRGKVPEQLQFVGGDQAAADNRVFSARVGVPKSSLVGATAEPGS